MDTDFRDWVIRELKSLIENLDRGVDKDYILDELTNISVEIENYSDD
jgi:hypothetical protein